MSGPLWFSRHSAVETAKGCWNPAFSLWRAYELERLARPSWREAALDLGCGDGTFGRLALPQARLVGLDIGIDLPAALAEEGYSLAVQADASRMPFADDAFGLVISNCAMEHMEHLEIVLSEVGRVLRPGGEFAFTVPPESFTHALWGHHILRRIGLETLAARYSERKNKRSQHINLLDPEDWARALRAHGLELLEADFVLPGIALAMWEFGNPLFGVCRPIVRALCDNRVAGALFRRAFTGLGDATLGTIYRSARTTECKANLYLLARKRSPEHG